MSVFGRPGNARPAGPGPKVMSRVSMASAVWAWRASAGLVATVRAGHHLQGRARDVPHGAVASGTLLQDGSELVKRQVVRAAELQDLAAQAGIGHRQLDEGGHVGGGDEIDRVVAAAEHQDLPGGLQRQAHDRWPRSP